MGIGGSVQAMVRSSQSGIRTRSHQRTSPSRVSLSTQVSPLIPPSTVHRLYEFRICHKWFLYIENIFIFFRYYGYSFYEIFILQNLRMIVTGDLNFSDICGVKVGNKSSFASWPKTRNVVCKIPIWLFAGVSEG